MTAPMFEDFDPASDCDCPGCVDRRRTSPRPPSGGLCGHPAAPVAVIMAAASAALGAVTPAAAVTPSLGNSPSPGSSPAPSNGPTSTSVPHVTPPPSDTPGDGQLATPQGARSRLHGAGGPPAVPGTVPTPATTRDQIISRAKTWVAAQVPYSMTSYWSDGYRQDCSGYVSMAWGLPTNEWTGSLDQFGVKITKDDLQSGDILLYHNPDNPEAGSHVVIFGGWTDSDHTHYTVYEQTPPHARSQTTPYPYWNNTDKYVPYRYKGLTETTAGTKQPAADTTQPAADTTQPMAGAAGAEPASHGVPGYPGRGHFLPGAENAYLAQLRGRLQEKGFGSFYALDPGPRWSEADRRAVEAFQRTQGWRGGAADGYPGPETWRRLFVQGPAVR